MGLACPIFSCNLVKFKAKLVSSLVLGWVASNMKLIFF